MKHTILLSILFYLLSGIFASNSSNSSQNYALFFAVNEYQNYPDLSHPVSDAKSIAKILKGNYRFQTEIIENPNLQDIENKLKLYAKDFQNQSKETEGQLLIFFSGHGDVEYDNGFFLPKDAKKGDLLHTGLSFDYWRRFINQIDCKHIMVAMDASHSVRFDENWKTRGFSEFNRPGEIGEEAGIFNLHKVFKARFLFTSDSRDDKVSDRSDFAKKFQEALISKGGNDGMLTSTEIYSFLMKANPQPHANEFGKDGAGSSFLFISDTGGSISNIPVDRPKIRVLDPDGLYSFGTGHGKGLNGRSPLSLSMPVYTEKEEGLLRFEFFIEPNGSVSYVKLVGVTNRPALQKAGIDAIKKWKFNPIDANERERVQVTIKFKLK